MTPLSPLSAQWVVRDRTGVTQIDVGVAGKVDLRYMSAGGAGAAPQNRVTAIP